MKLKVLPIALVTILGLGSGATAQGLLGMRSDDDFYSALPFTTSIGVSAGWDSNPSSSPVDEQDSAFTRGSIDMAYGSPSKTTPVRFGLGVGGIYYLDDLEGVDEDFFWDIRFSLNASHAFSRRFVVGNNFYLSYEIEPDFAIGATDQSRLDQYLYGYDSLWASYQLSRRLSAITRYTISGIRYDESEVGAFEDRFTHTIGEEFRYMWDRRNVLVAEYRYTSTDYDIAPRDYTEHTVLGGIDHDFSRTLLGTFRGGVDFRDEDFAGSESRPHFEVGLRQRLAENTQLHWMNRVGLEDSDLGTFESRYSYRSVLSVSHAISSRLRVSGGLSYIYSSYEDSPITDDTTEDLVSANVGLGYRVFSNVDLTADYTFTGVYSDEEFREYDRHRVSLGLSTTF